MKTEKKNTSSNKRKIGIALIAGLAMSGIIGASAATLNGLNSDQLGADVTDVSSCDADGVTLDYVTSYDAILGEYEVASVEVSSVDPSCEGQAFDLTLTDDLDAILDDVAGNVSLTAGAFTVTLGADIPAEDVYGAALVISGVDATP